MKTSEVLKSLLCDPNGNVCIQGSPEDKRLLQEAIKDVKGLELKQINTSDCENGAYNCATLDCRIMKNPSKCSPSCPRWTPRKGR